MYPSRPMTAEELAEVDWPDTTPRMPRDDGSLA